MTRWDVESNERVYERRTMGSHANGVSCSVVDWVKTNSLRWFGHIERKGNEEFVKKVFVQTVEEGHLGDGGTE